jgi:hypothetical protein
MVWAQMSTFWTLRLRCGAISVDQVQRQCFPGNSFAQPLDFIQSLVPSDSGSLWGWPQILLYRNQTGQRLYSTAYLNAGTIVERGDALQWARHIPSLAAVTSLFVHSAGLLLAGVLIIVNREAVGTCWACGMYCAHRSLGFCNDNRFN